MRVPGASRGPPGEAPVTGISDSVAAQVLLPVAFMSLTSVLTLVGDMKYYNDSAQGVVGLTTSAQIPPYAFLLCNSSQSPCVIVPACQIDPT